MTSLDDARETVSKMISQDNVPMNLVGAMTLDDLLRVTDVVVNEGIKDSLADMDQLSEAQAQELIETTISSIALRMALVAVQATLTELVDYDLGESPSTADIHVPMPPELVATILTRLLSGTGAVIKLEVSES